MSDPIVRVGVSPATHRLLVGGLGPRVELVVVPTHASLCDGSSLRHPTNIDVLWRRQHDRSAWVDTVLDQFPALRWIHTDTAGVDRLPLARLRRQQVALTNARGAHTPAVAEWAVGAILLASKNFHQTIRDSDARRWAPHEDDLLLRGRTVLILGLGEIGRYLSGVCSALGMRVLGISRSGKPVDGVDHVVSSSDAWIHLLKKADFLVNCLPLTPETEGIVNLSVLSKLSRPGYLINVGRGSTVVESDVLIAVRSGALRGAFLDTVRIEPLAATSELWTCPGVIISPHAASFNDATDTRTRALFQSEVDRYIAGLPMLNRVSLERGY